MIYKIKSFLYERKIYFFIFGFLLFIALLSLFLFIGRKSDLQVEVGLTSDSFEVYARNLDGKIKNGLLYFEVNKLKEGNIIDSKILIDTEIKLKKDEEEKFIFDFQSLGFKTLPDGYVEDISNADVINYILVGYYEGASKELLLEEGDLSGLTKFDKDINNNLIKGVLVTKKGSSQVSNPGFYQDVVNLVSDRGVSGERSSVSVSRGGGSGPITVSNSPPSPGGGALTDSEVILSVEVPITAQEGEAQTLENVYNALEGEVSGGVTEETSGVMDITQAPIPEEASQEIHAQEATEAPQPAGEGTGEGQQPTPAQEATEAPQPAGEGTGEGQQPTPAQGVLEEAQPIEDLEQQGRDSIKKLVESINILWDILSRSDWK